MKKRIYILGLSRFTSPSGICRYAFNLTEILSGLDDVEVSLLVGEWQKEYFEKAFNWANVKANLEIVSIKNNSIWRNFWFIFILPFIVNKRKVDWLFLAFPIPFFGIFSRNTKIVTSIHDLYPFEYPKNFRFPFFNRLFTKISANSADMISALSYSTAIKIKKFLPSYSKKVLVNYTPFQYRNIENFPEKNGSDYFLTVAQHRKNKNLDILIRAFAIYSKQEFSNKRKLLIIGSSGPETLNLKRLVYDLSIEEKVFFKHSISDEDLIKYYINCSCFILLSSTEGLGIPLIESLYYSKYIICSNISVFKEIDIDNCNFVDLDNNPVDQLVNYLISNDLKKNNKYKIIDSRFEIENIRSKYYSLINS